MPKRRRGRFALIHHPAQYVLAAFVGASTIVATGFSGWGFMGSPGVTYEYGAIEVLGNFFFAPAMMIAVLFFANSMRKRALKMGSNTIPEYIAQIHGGGDGGRLLQGVAAFITDLEGQPFAPCSRCSRFCQLVHSRPEGMAACQASWRAIAQLNQKGAAIHVCHAGIQYASAPVSVGGQRLGMVTAGQFLTEAPDPDEFRTRALATGERIGVSGEGLADAIASINIVSPATALQITALLQTIANAISSIGYQGYQARQTLAQIAQLTAQASQPPVNPAAARGAQGSSPAVTGR